MAADNDGNLYIADRENGTIRKILPGGLVTTLAGTAGIEGSADGVGAAAQFKAPAAVAVDGTGNVYVNDQFNFTIRKITPDGTVTTLAGTAGVQGSTDGTGPAAQFELVCAIAVDDTGTAYVTDEDNNIVRKISPTGKVTTLAGTANGFGSKDGTGPAAQFSFPTGITVDNGGNLYVADVLNETIRKITPAGVVTTLAGTVEAVGRADGTGAAARFNQPNGVALDSNGNLHIADRLNDTIRKMTPSHVVTTLAGTASLHGRADGMGAAARFDGPTGISVDGSGNIYIADYNNFTIRCGDSGHI